MLGAGAGIENETFSGPPLSGAGVGCGASTFVEDVRNIDTGGGEFFGATATGGAAGVGTGCIVSGSPEVTTESFVSVETGVWSDMIRGMG